MVQPIACVLNRARHPLTSFAGVMGKLTVTLVNWRRTLAIVTELLQSRAKDFAKVSENDTHLTRSVNRAFSKQIFQHLLPIGNLSKINHDKRFSASARRQIPAPTIIFVSSRMFLVVKCQLIRNN